MAGAAVDSGQDSGVIGICRFIRNIFCESSVQHKADGSLLADNGFGSTAQIGAAQSGVLKSTGDGKQHDYAQNSDADRLTDIAGRGLDTAGLLSVAGIDCSCDDIGRL